MHQLIIVLACLHAQLCSSLTVTLSGSADYAVLDQTFRFICTVTDEDAPTLGSLIFTKDDSSAACVVIPSSCSQNGISPGYSCGCVSGQRDVYYMNISNVSVQKDEGTWRCQRRSQTSNSITLPVYYGPFNNVTLDKSSPQRVTEFSSLTVVCSSTCKPCSYTWRRGTVTVSNTKTLSLTNINRNQDGNYICSATNTALETSATSTLTVDVQYKPVISGQDSSYSLVESSPLHINCSSYTTPGNPSTTSYRWTGPDSYTSTGPVLTINSISRTQTGQYTCTATNSLTPTGGPPQTGTDTGQFMVDVQYLQITSFTLNSNTDLVTVSESDHVTMICQVDSNPGSTISLLNGSNVLSRADNSLIEFKWTAECRQRGKYSCVAMNNIDDIGIISKNIVLHVKCLPRLGVPPKKKITAAVGDDTTLSVTLLSYPEPNITWRKTTNTSLRNLTSISSVSRVSDISVTSSLILTGVQQQDFGEYFVQADNGFGTPVTFTVRLVTKGEESSVSRSTPAGLIAGVTISLIALVAVIAVAVFLTRRGYRCVLLGPGSEVVKKVRQVGNGSVNNEFNERTVIPENITTNNTYDDLKHSEADQQAYEELKTYQNTSAIREKHGRVETRQYENTSFANSCMGDNYEETNAE